MKKILLIILLIITSSLLTFSIICFINKNKAINIEDKNSITKIIIKNDFIEYNSKINLYSLISIENGKIITDDFDVETSKLETKNLTFKYKNSNGHIKEYIFKVNIVDTTVPLIFSQKKYYVERGAEINLTKKPMYGDNYDKSIDFKVEGTYDINTIGEYDLNFIATDSSNNVSTKEFKLVVVDKLDNTSYTPTPIYLNDVISNYKNDNTMIGIDVSTWQGDINWSKVRNAGIEFAIIRIGFGPNKEMKNVLDNKFEKNLKEAKDAGIKVGIYFFSYAENNKESKDEAKWIIDKLNGEKLDFPIAFDWEIWNSFNNLNMSFTDLNNMALTFFEELNNNNYDGMIYGSLNYLEYIWNLASYDTWLAHYTDETNYSKDYYIWQLTSNGIVDGIEGYVDLNVLYKKA